MESKTFKVIGALLSVIGAIVGIVLGFTCEEHFGDFNVGLMLETWILFDLLALFFGWLGSVLEKLENIEQSVCGESDDSNSYLQTAVTNIHNKLAKEPTENEWKCPKCGRINQNYVGTCGCGELKPESYTWRCPKCGKINKSISDVDVCSCGYSPMD